MMWQASLTRYVDLWSKSSRKMGLVCFTATQTALRQAIQPADTLALQTGRVLRGVRNN